MFVAAAGAALVAMVARICAGNPKYGEHATLLERTLADAERLREEFAAARVRDETAYERVVAAQALAPGDGRRAQLDAALFAAAAVPLESAGHALHGLHLASDLLAVGNRSLASDVGCAAEFFGAAIAACAYNVLVNHRYMKERDGTSEQAQQLDAVETEGRRRLHDVRAGVAALLAR